MSEAINGISRIYKSRLFVILVNNILWGYLLVFSYHFYHRTDFFLAVLLGVLGNLVFLYYLRLLALNRHKGSLWFKGKSMEEISRAAAERRNRITQFLSPDTNNLLFFEQPPGRELAFNRQNENTQSEDYLAQTIKLEWQIEAPGLLLAERLTDTLLLLFDQFEIKSQYGNHFHFPTISLIYTESKPDIFPWQVVIATDLQYEIKRLLTPYLDWLAIGIRFAPQVRNIAFSRCQESGKEGVTGGSFARNTDTPQYAVTCTHVVTPSCLSTLYQSYPSGRLFDMKPDAALLAMNSPCFPVSPQAPKPIRTADNPFIELLLVYHGVVGMIFPASVRARGRVISRGIAFEYDGVVNRFPHLVVTQASYWFFFMKFPLFRKLPG